MPLRHSDRMEGFLIAPEEFIPIFHELRFDKIDCARSDAES
jgi:hypothetical protein